MSSELTAAALVALTATSDHRGGVAVGSAGFPVNTAGHKTGTRHSLRLMQTTVTRRYGRQRQQRGSRG